MFRIIQGFVEVDFAPEKRREILSQSGIKMTAVKI